MQSACCVVSGWSLQWPRMFRIESEIASQPEIWSAALDHLAGAVPDLPSVGERVAVIGCGTSSFVAQSYAALRETAAGETDAFVASEFAPRRGYDRVVAISRSGTTTEVLRALEEASAAGMPSVAITAVAGSPVTKGAGSSLVLDLADEVSVVQTRFATTTLALLRAHLGENLSGAIADGHRALEVPLPAEPSSFEQFVFLGTGWTIGLADEAALKMREAALAWSESYPAMEYRHGPISLASERTLAWFVGEVDTDLRSDVAATGGTIVGGTLDAMAELVLVQRAAVRLAIARGLDPDNPRHLTRSVVL
jgi:fructoselysine-6-P-deglycase FrlB-like protein